MTDDEGRRVREFLERGRAAQDAVDRLTRPVVLRLRYRVLGGHVHCRLFSGPAPAVTFAKCGDLTFRLEEWAAVQQLLGAAIEIVDDEVALVTHARQLVAAGGTHDCSEWEMPDGRCALCWPRKDQAWPDCICRTAGCGHRASEHRGPNGACLICEQECWS